MSAVATFKWRARWEGSFFDGFAMFGYAINTGHFWNVLVPPNSGGPNPLGVGYLSGGWHYQDTAILVSPNTWYEFELKTIYPSRTAWLKVDGVLDPNGPFGLGSDPADTIGRDPGNLGFQPKAPGVGNITSAPIYFDDVWLGGGDWEEDGGIVCFTDDFESSPVVPDSFIPPWENELIYSLVPPFNALADHHADPADAGNTVGRFYGTGGYIDTGCVFTGIPIPPPTPVAATPTPTMGILGCGIYEIQVLTRGGRHLVHTLPYTDLEWGRILDDTSQATLTIAGLAGRGNGCCEKIADIRPWKHELSILRNGEECWVGPIVKPTVDADTATIVARDLTAWWDKRFIHKDHDYGVVDLAFLFAQFAYDAMEPDNTPGIHVIATECQILGEHKVLAVDHRIAGQELRSLADIGVDWTAFVREIVAGGVVVPLTELPDMYDAHFVEPPAVALDGLAQENHTGVRGNGVGASGDAIYGDALDSSSAQINGLLEGIVSQETAGTNLAAQAGAQSRLELVKDAIGIIEQGILAYSAPFPMNDLIPGRAVPVRLGDTCYPVDGFFRIGGVQVRATASEGAVTETVAVSFMPLGTTFRRRHYPPRQIITPGSGLP